MAPTKQATRERGADGAPPGATSGSNGKHAFDADGRAKEREDAPVTIGEKTFHRRRKNWEVTRGLRALLRRQERAGVRADRARKKIDALAADAPDSEIDALEDEVDLATDDSDQAAYEIIALLLRDEQDANPDVDHLKSSLDVEDAGALAATLAGGGHEDPSPPTPSSSTP